ncbi:hypothetical protein [Haladaptatus caseinilyticus]|uniref:hypothetical protein n=1 Tax=Haladaptatus caseinilyticus TaxID=2993314 RepID=UPI00224B74EB|nr:hypothetical protein [Haladaptatus caseinilyticus]
MCKDEQNEGESQSCHKTRYSCRRQVEGEQRSPDADGVEADYQNMAGNSDSMEPLADSLSERRVTHWPQRNHGHNESNGDPASRDRIEWEQPQYQ